jgi:Na+/H+-dicarboxylate symporter
MKTKITQEYLLPLSFFLGFLIAYIVPFKIAVFVFITDVFVKTFLLFAPLIVFIIIFTSTCSLQSEKMSLGRFVKISVVMYISLIFLSAIFTSLMLSILLLANRSGFRGNGTLEAYSQIYQTILVNLSNLVFPAIIVGFAAPLLLARTRYFHKILHASKYLNSGEEIFFKILIKILPLICLSLGARLYYDLGQVTLNAYITSMGLTFALGTLFLISFLLTIRKLMFKKINQIYRYSKETFLTAFTIGSSYIFLPLNIKIFCRYFEMDKRVRDFILTLGASLNRCGSVIGVLVVIFVSAFYNNYGLSWQQMLSLAIPVALLGFGSPGIHGGTLLVTLPVILQTLSPPNPEKFASTALALFVGGTAFPQVAVNSVTTGYVALLVDHFAHGKASKH